MEMTLGNYFGEDSWLSLADSNFSIEVVTVHDGKSIEDEVYGEIVEGLWGELSLRE